MQSMSDNPYDRPLIVTIIGVLYALGAIVLIIAGAAFMVGGEAMIDELVKQDASLDALKGLGLGLGVAYLILGIISGVISYGFFKGWSIMWYLGVIFTIIGVLFNIAAVVMGGFAAIVTLVILLIILLYLFKPNVKLYFLKHS